MRPLTEPLPTFLIRHTSLPRRPVSHSQCMGCGQIATLLLISIGHRHTHLPYEFKIMPNGLVPLRPCILSPHPHSQTTTFSMHSPYSPQWPFFCPATFHSPSTFLPLLPPQTTMQRIREVSDLMPHVLVASHSWPQHASTSEFCWAKPHAHGR